MFESLKLLAEFIKNKPTVEALLFCMLAFIAYREWAVDSRSTQAHTMVRAVLHERDEAEAKRAEAAERNADRIVSALTGVKKEVSKIPEAAAKAAARLVDSKPDTKGAPEEDGPGIQSN